VNLLALRNESTPVSGQDAAVEIDGTSGSPLRSAVSRAVARYLTDMDDHANGDLFALLMAEVEAPMLAEVMRHCEGKQVRAAEVLGINRATLRKKLRQYGLA
jgi:Fis family transcriptional regulator